MSKQSNHQCHCGSNCGCHSSEEHSCSCSGSKKTEYNNQWVSPASAKSSVCESCKCNKKLYC